MLQYPWTNIFKELKKRSEDVEKHPEKLIELKSIDDLFDSLTDYKPTIFDRFRWWFHEFSWQVYYYFNPSHKQIRDSIPKRFVDISSLIQTVNFEFVKSFHDNEMHTIEWDSDPQHKEFEEWITSSYQYITVERAKLEEELNHSYPKRGAKGTYEEKYADVIRLEKLIQDKDTEILTEIVKRREMFWS